jgi:Zn-finger domain-containing protein
LKKGGERTKNNGKRVKEWLFVEVEGKERGEERREKNDDDDEEPRK